MPPNKRTQIRNYDVHDAAQEKVLPDLIENDEDPITLENLVSNLDRIRSKLKKTTGEASFQDDPISNIRELAGRTFSTAVTDTWGIIARTQGMIIAPEGPVSDDGNGNISVSTILVANPLTSTFVRIADSTQWVDPLSVPFSGQLGENSYVYFDLPPTSPVNQTIIPIVIQDNPFNPPASPPYNPYPSEDRVILCQRIGTGHVWFKFNWSVALFS